MMMMNMRMNCGRCFSSGGDNDSLHEMTKQRLGEISSRMTLVFTCNKCGTRAARTFSKQAYTKGAVLVICPGCQAMHVVADNVDFFGYSSAKEASIEGEVTRIAAPPTAVGDGDAFAQLSDADRALVQASIDERIKYEQRSRGNSNDNQ
jgi:hypothetical protein